MALVGDMTLSSDTPLSDDYFEVKRKNKKILDNSNYNYQSVKAALYDIAKEYCSDILKNTTDDDWSLRYFVAETYMTL